MPALRKPRSAGTGGLAAGVGVCSPSPGLWAVESRHPDL